MNASATSAKNIYFAAAGILLVLVVAVTARGTRGHLLELYDYGEHVASIREMAADLAAPGNPLLDDPAPTLRYTPYILLLACIVKFTPLNIFTVITLAAAFNVLVLTIGIYLWSSEYFRDASMPVYVLAVMLFAWGRPFGYSNEYSLRFFAYTAFYPSMFSFCLGFPGMYCLLRAVRCKRPGFAVGCFACGICIVMTHPLTGSFFLLCCLLLLVTESPRPAQHLLLFFLGCLAAGLLTVLWPFYPFFKALARSTMTPWYDFKMYLYSADNVLKIGPGLLGLPVLAWMLLKKQYPFLVLGFACCAVIYAAGGIVDIFLLDRYVFFGVFFLHAALALLFRKLGVLSLNRWRAAGKERGLQTGAALLAGLILLASSAYQGALLACEQAGYLIEFLPRFSVVPYKDPQEKYRHMRGLLARGDVVLSDPLSSWLIPAFTGAKIVALYHNNPMVDDNSRRTEAVVEFYNPRTTLRQRRDIAARYGVTHVLLNRDRMRPVFPNTLRDYHLHFSISDILLNDLNRLGKVVYDGGDIILYCLQQASQRRP